MNEAQQLSWYLEMKAAHIQILKNQKIILQYIQIDSETIINTEEAMEETDNILRLIADESGKKGKK